MIYGFDTDDPIEATASLCVYAVWRSRDRTRFKITPDVWGRVERFTKASAKRATTVGEFLDALKPRLLCPTIHPRAMAVAYSADYYAGQEGPREFLTAVLGGVDNQEVLRKLYRETTLIVLLVRDRLERERPVEATIEARLVDFDGDESAEEEVSA